MEESKIISWVIAFAIFFVIPFWKLLKRMGFKPIFALVVLVPGGILVLIWVIDDVHDPSAIALRSTVSDSINR